MQAAAKAKAMQCKCMPKPNQSKCKSGQLRSAAAAVALKFKTLRGHRRTLELCGCSVVWLPQYPFVVECLHDATWRRCRLGDVLVLGAGLVLMLGDRWLTDGR